VEATSDSSRWVVAFQVVYGYGSRNWSAVDASNLIYIHNHNYKLQLLQVQSINPNKHIITMADQQYKPTEHGGLKQDGTPDKRVGTGEFAQGKVDPHEAGKQGGHTSGSGSTGDSEGTGSGNSGGSAKGQFAHGKVDPVEAGKKGGNTS